MPISKSFPTSQKLFQQTPYIIVLLIFLHMAKSKKVGISTLTQAGYSPFVAFAWCSSCRRWIPKSRVITWRTGKKLMTRCPECGALGVRLRPHQKIAKKKVPLSLPTPNKL
ncbi:hypothetical protein B9P99_03005 [Candidatus Marsarchaeota G1 archaeon OSP_B]|uniref:Uncharacterized protein n=1 Tax=Candidatus Marsarchaeota G1 archaeon OSP_B TaxID=1978153 RepID=A0A2R6B2P8_9ARCH|nr:MAG: hypothetical protein B9P99_03005 [Candidatus Marsarchaeota G1 archaeon OSP_B]